MSSLPTEVRLETLIRLPAVFLLAGPTLVSTGLRRSTIPAVPGTRGSVTGARATTSRTASCPSAVSGDESFNNLILFFFLAVAA